MTQQQVEQKAKEIYRQMLNWLIYMVATYEFTISHKEAAKALCYQQIDAMIEAQRELDEALGNRLYEISQQYTDLLAIKEYIKNKL